MTYETQERLTVRLSHHDVTNLTTIARSMAANGTPYISKSDALRAALAAVAADLKGLTTGQPSGGLQGQAGVA